MDTISTAVLTFYGAFTGAVVAGLIDGLWIALPAAGGLLALLAVYVNAKPEAAR